MKKNLKNVAAILLVLTLCMTMFAPTAFAADFNTSDLTATVELSGTIVDAEEDYVIKLKADDSSYPMPAGSVDGVYTMKVTGEGSANFPSMTFSDLGIYTYKVWQEAGSNEFGTYDNTVYNVKFTVTNKADYSGFNITPAIYAEGNDKDKCEIVSRNDYANPYTELTVKKIWDGDGDALDERPDYIKVQLFNGDKAVEVITLSEDSDWKYTWKKLYINGDWSAKEIDVPSGYENTSTDKEGNVVTITNTKVKEKLEQTGQLNWPVPVLGVLGAVMIVLGLVIGRKKRTDA